MTHLAKQQTLTTLLRAGYTPSVAIQLMPSKLRDDIADVNMHLIAASTITVTSTVLMTMAGLPALFIVGPVAGVMFYDRYRLKKSLINEQRLMQDPMARQTLLQAAETSEIALINSMAILTTAKEADDRTAMPSDALSRAIREQNGGLSERASSVKSAKTQRQFQGSIEDRVMQVFESLSDDGFPIKILIESPLLLCHGPSQSGKSTFAHILMVLRAAHGQCGTYVTHHDRNAPLVTDQNISMVGRGNNWQGLRDAFIGILQNPNYENPIEGGVDLFYHVDEVSELLKPEDNGIPDDIAKLFGNFVRCNITKGAKTKTRLVMLAQAATVGELNLDDVSASLIKMLAIVSAQPNVNATAPTGRYLVSFPGSNATYTWQIPQWLYGVKTDGRRCPLEGLLDIFPEFRGEPFGETVSETVDEPAIDRQSIARNTTLTTPIEVPQPIEEELPIVDDGLTFPFDSPMMSPMTSPPKPAAEPTTSIADVTPHPVEPLPWDWKTTLTTGRGYMRITGNVAGIDRFFIEISVEGFLNGKRQVATFGEPVSCFASKFHVGGSDVETYVDYYANYPKQSVLFIVNGMDVPPKLAMLAVSTPTMVLHIIKSSQEPTDNMTIVATGVKDGIYRYRCGDRAFTIE